MSEAVLGNRGPYTGPHTLEALLHEVKGLWDKGNMSIRIFGPLSSTLHSRYPGPQNCLSIVLELTCRNCMVLLPRSIC